MPHSVIINIEMLCISDFILATILNRILYVKYYKIYYYVLINFYLKEFQYMCGGILRAAIGTIVFSFPFYKSYPKKYTTIVLDSQIYVYRNLLMYLLTYLMLSLILYRWVDMF